MAKSTTLERQADARAFLDTGKLALVYPRQSSGKQVQENIYSLENQLKLRDRAIADGFPGERVIVIDDDLGKSAQTIAGRVGMSRALGLIDQGLVGALYAEDQTRLSRDVDTVDHMEIGKRCRLARVPMFYGGSWRDMNDRGSRLAYKVEAVIGSEMWAGHVEKMHTARKLKAERGRVATQAVRRGYRLNRDVPRNHPDRDKLLVNEPEAAIIRELAAQLADAGSVRELYRRTHPVYWPDGAKLTCYALRNILMSPIYRGVYVWGEVRIEDAHEAIITPAQAAAIDALISENRAIARRPASGNGAGILCGLAWCATCARKMYGGRAGDRTAYRCQERSAVERTPFHFSIEGSALDRLVVAELMVKLEAGLIARIVERLEHEQKQARAVVNLSEAGRRALDRQIAGLTRALGDPDLTDAARKVVLVQLDKAAREIEALSRRSPEAPHVAADLDAYRAMRDDAGFLDGVRATWDDEPLTWRRRFVRRFVERVSIRRERSGQFAITLLFRDSSATTFPLVTNQHATPDELALVRTLLASPERPARGWYAWVQAELAKAGYNRTPAGVHRLIAIATDRAWVRRGAARS